MPDSTTSTRSHRCVPSATQSEGVPFTRHASNPATAAGRHDSGREAVIACPIEDCSTSGATMRTCPNADAQRASATRPGL